MSKRLSSHAAKRSRTSYCTPKKKVGERDNAVPYFSLRCGLADHALYTDGYRIDYSDLL